MKKWLYPLSCLVLVSTLTACATNNAAGPNADRQNPTVNQVRPYGYDMRYDRSYGPTAAPGVYDRTLQGGAMYNRDMIGDRYVDNRYMARRDYAFNRQKADRLARAANNVTGVDGATAIVRGNDAVIGINSSMTANNPRQRQALERRVHAVAKSMYPMMNIRVTTDKNMLSRIRNMDQTLRNNSVTTAPTTVGGNLDNAGEDFAALLRDLGRTVTAPFR
ncbi:MAG: YhcN/YlaJ family sporulation lipoprotein [Brevibacillus sp.]|nr:YhcN/YlaJ family sporulation lipoprotein [Brevibacillus sp.]